MPGLRNTTSCRHGQHQVMLALRWDTHAHGEAALSLCCSIAVVNDTKVASTHTSKCKPSNKSRNQDPTSSSPHMPATVCNSWAHPSPLPMQQIPSLVQPSQHPLYRVLQHTCEANRRQVMGVNDNLTPWTARVKKIMLTGLYMCSSQQPHDPKASHKRSEAASYARTRKMLAAFLSWTKLATTKQHKTKTAGKASVGPGPQ